MTEFDKDVAYAEAKALYKSDDPYVKSEHEATKCHWIFVDGCRWQHSQDRAKIERLKDLLRGVRSTGAIAGDLKYAIDRALAGEGGEK